MTFEKDLRRTHHLDQTYSLHFIMSQSLEVSHQSDEQNDTSFDTTLDSCSVSLDVLEDSSQTARKRKVATFFEEDYKGLDGVETIGKGLDQSQSIPPIPSWYYLSAVEINDELNPPKKQKCKV